MSNIYKVLKDFISVPAQIPFNDKKQYLTIIEEDPELTDKHLKSVNLVFGQNDTKNAKCIFHFAFKLDDKQYRFLGKLIKDDVKNIRKAVDAVVICEYNNRKRILLIELKSKVNDSLEKKIKSSKLVVNYIKDYLNVFSGVTLDGFEYCSILFDRRPIKQGKRKDFKKKYAGDELFYHQGFGKSKNNTAFIENFIG